MTWLEQGVTCCAALRAKMKGIGGQRESQQLPRLGPPDHPSLEAHPTEANRRKMTALTQKTFFKVLKQTAVLLGQNLLPWAG